MSSRIGQQHIGHGQQIIEHFKHDDEHQRGQQDFQVLAAQLFADLGAELGADGGAEQ